MTPPPDARAAAPSGLDVGALAAMSTTAGSSAAFQGLLLAAGEAVADVRARVDVAVDAGGPPGHGRVVLGTAADLAEAAEALEAGLSHQGRCLLSRPEPPSRAARALLRLGRRLRDEPSAAPARLGQPAWLQATAEAIEAAGEAARHLCTLASAQPEGSAARQLGLRVAAFLARHRDALLADVARFVD